MIVINWILSINFVGQISYFFSELTGVDSGVGVGVGVEWLFLSGVGVGVGVGFEKNENPGWNLKFMGFKVKVEVFKKIV